MADLRDPPTDALARLARADIAAVLENVREEARSELRAVLKERYLTAALDAAVELLGATGHDSTVGPETSVRPANLDRVDDDGWYVYGFVDRDAGAGLEGLHGVDDAATRVIRGVGAAALASPVDVTRPPWSTPDRLDANDVEHAVVAHHRILDDALRRGTVVPMRFGVVLRSHDALVQLLASRSHALSELLKKLDGAAEWGVKVSSSVSSPARQTDRSESGVAYLRARRDSLDADEAFLAASAEAAANLHHHLGHVARSSVLHSQSADSGRTGSSGNRRTIAQGAYLVARDDELRFHHTLEESIGAFGGGVDLRADVSGPWPPYSFVDDVLTEEATA